MEFENKDIKSYFESKGIAKYKSTRGNIKAAFAERMLKTMKQRIYKYMSDKNTLEWTKVLPKVVNAIKYISTLFFVLLLYNI